MLKQRRHGTQCGDVTVVIAFAPLCQPLVGPRHIIH